MKNNKGNRSKRKSERKSIDELVTPWQEQLRDTNYKPNKITNVQNKEMYKNEHDQQTQIEQSEGQKLSQMVSQLISKNKINSKNAFQVPFVNVNELRSYNYEDDSSWSRISSTLQNSSKIYGYRVDFVSQHISKMTSNITRSMVIQNKQAKQPQQTTQVEIKIQQISNKYDNIDLKVHLEQQKLKQDKLTLENKQFVNSRKIKRMFDQNSLQGLILVNAQLSPELSLRLIVQNISSYLPKVLQSQVKSDITHKISNISIEQLHFMQIMDEKKKKIIKNYGQVTRQKSDQINLNYSECAVLNEQFQICECIDYLQKEQHNLETQRSFYFIDNKQTEKYDKKQSNKPKLKKQPKDEKLKRNPIKGMVKKRKPIAKQPYDEDNLKFQLNQILQQQKVFKKKQTNPKANKVEAMDNAFDYSKNMMDNTLQILQKDWSVAEKSLYQSFCVDNQMLMSEGGTLDMLQHGQSISTQSIGVIVSAQQCSMYKQKDLKCPSMKDNKQQLLTILRQFHEINFSELHLKHRKEGQSVSQAIDFVSLLHLCNEFNLLLIEQSASDFTIQKC